MNKKPLIPVLLASSIGLASGLTVAAETKLEILVTSGEDDFAITEALTKAYSTKNPDISFDIDMRPGGAEGDNLVKTRLATGEMADVFWYNSGSLFQALKPERSLTPLNDLPNVQNVLSSFSQTVSVGDDIYGVPQLTAMGGGIFYNREIYAELGLEIPLTWDQFMANNSRIAAESKAAPVAQTYSDTWTSQLFVLADYFNVQAKHPEFADEYTANKANYATTPAAMAGFSHLQEVFEAGYLNKDFGAASYEEGLYMVASGEAAHYPMLTFAISAIAASYPDMIDNVGFFAQPGESADSNGMTVWMPAAWYIPKDTDKMEAAKDFVNFLASTEACDIITATVGATGPYLVKGCELPDDVPPAVADMMPYFQADGRTAPALEFLSPVKGPALEQITVEVGSGIRDAQSAAELYDRDVEKQAKQLGLPNW